MLKETRRREHEYAHERTLEAQTLDVLLRMEELLEKLVAAGAATRVHDEVQVTTDVSEKTLAELVKDAKPPRGKRKSEQL